MKKKKCCRCGRLLPLSAFGKNKASGDGLTYACKKCMCISTKKWRDKNPEKAKASVKKQRGKKVYRSAKSRKKRAERNRVHNWERWYGLTEQGYYAMLEKQKGVCAICGKPETHKGPLGKGPRNLSVDHDHKTGKVRGLLCAGCNVAIGLFGEDFKVLKNVLKYLKERR